MSEKTDSKGRANTNHAMIDADIAVSETPNLLKQFAELVERRKDVMSECEINFDMDDYLACAIEALQAHGWSAPHDTKSHGDETPKPKDTFYTVFPNEYD